MPAVIGADLFNEPKKSGPTWGIASSETDWNKAAERCGNAILEAHPHWLIIVEGITVYSYPDASNSMVDTYSWWGANLVGVATNPVVLTKSDKLVYSIHEYPMSVSVQPWFYTADYPNDLHTTWKLFWGYIFENNIAPIIIGEMGTFLETTSDKQWLEKLTDYMAGDFMLNGQNSLPVGKKGISWTFWCLNPDSHDTGGIFEDDWLTVRQDKMTYLQASLDPDSISLGIISATPSFQPSLQPITAEPTPSPLILSVTILLVNCSVPKLDDAYTLALITTLSQALALSESAIIVASSEPRRRRLAELYILTSEVNLYIPHSYTTSVERQTTEQWTETELAYADLHEFVYTGEATKVGKDFGGDGSASVCLFVCLFVCLSVCLLVSVCISVVSLYTLYTLCTLYTLYTLRCSRKSYPSSAGSSTTTWVSLQ